MMSNFVLWLAPAGSLLAIFFAAYLTYKILKEPRGSAQIIEIQNAIELGAKAYIKRQYGVVAIFFGVVFGILLWMARNNYLPIFVPFAFVTGGFFSGLAGYVGMRVATKANGRTANAAITSLNKALRIAFSGGTVLGLSVVGLGLLDLSLWFFGLNFFYRNMEMTQRILVITSTMLTFEMGASSMALFARVGGGIFTKAADVGADLVGKVEAGIPEDDPRNPAVIADNVGDNVGDVAGMGADLYESYVGTIVATMVLAVAAGFGLEGVILTMAMAAVGIICSIVGTFFVRAREEASQKELLRALRRGIFIAAGLIFVLSYFTVKHILGAENIGIYGSIASGLIAGIIIGLSTEFFTSDHYSPAKSIADSSKTGPATVVIRGLSTGMMSTSIPVLVVGGAILSSYFFAGGAENFNAGLYGVGIASVGMLSTLGITLATDAYGPIADNAGGIAEMSKQKPYVRERTDALDALGNTTAATGKGFAIGSAALTSLALIAAYKDEIFRLGKDLALSLLDPKVMVGLFIGGMLPYLFSSLTMRAVGRAASSIVLEVRRQFSQIKGLMEGKAKPDYESCVNICTVSAQKEMIFPSLVAVVTPIGVGLLMGVEAVVGLLAGALASGFVMAIMMANAGGIWDNAKKYVEQGRFGGKGSAQHKALVVGDTIGDPFKDTSGPSLNILIKLMSMVSVVFAAFILANSIVK